LPEKQESDQELIQRLVDTALEHLGQAAKWSEDAKTEALVGIGYVLVADFTLRMARRTQSVCPAEHVLGEKCALCGSR